jgi:BFD-like [2Fe-2S] binding domain.
MQNNKDRSRNLGDYLPAADDAMIICRCEEITKGEIRKAVPRWDVHINRNQTLFKNRYGSLSGANLRPLDQGDCSPGNLGYPPLDLGTGGFPGHRMRPLENEGFWEMKNRKRNLD